MEFGLRNPHYLVGNNLPDYAATTMTTNLISHLSDYTSSELRKQQQECRIIFNDIVKNHVDHFCGLVVIVLGYRSRGSGFDSWCYQIF
jgi:hypothetical protein